jgi:hypothetical protein
MAICDKVCNCVKYLVEHGESESEQKLPAIKWN